MITKNDIGAKIKEYVESTYISQVEAGRALGISGSTISSLIKGRWLPNDSVLRAMKLHRVDIKDSTGKTVDIAYEEEWEMKLRKFNQLYRGMTSISKKVYEAVPAEGGMTIQQIAAEMGKTSTMQFGVLEACLNQMRESGLLNRNSKGEYSRETVETPSFIEVKEELTPELPPVITPETKEPEPIMTTPVQTETKLSPLELLAILAKRTQAHHDLAKKLAEDAQMLVESSAKLMQDMESTALTIQEQIEHDFEELVRLRQLQANLKSFMGA